MNNKTILIYFMSNFNNLLQLFDLRFDYYSDQRLQRTISKQMTQHAANCCHPLIGRRQKIITELSVIRVLNQSDETSSKSFGNKKCTLTRLPRFTLGVGGGALIPFEINKFINDFVLFCQRNNTLPHVFFILL